MAAAQAAHTVNSFETKCSLKNQKKKSRHASRTHGTYGSWSLVGLGLWLRGRVLLRTGAGTLKHPHPCDEANMSRPRFR